MDLAGHRNLFNADWGAFFWAPGIWQPEGFRVKFQIEDRAEYDRLLQKEHAARDLLGDSTTEPVTREGLLDEALGLLRTLEDQR